MSDVDPFEPTPTSLPIVPGWPAGVLPPDLPGFPESAVAWLLDYGDPGWRTSDPVLRRHPAVLVGFVLARVQADLEAARQMWADLAEVEQICGSEAARGLQRLLEREGARLAERVRAVTLVAEALHGRRWVPKL